MRTVLAPAPHLHHTSHRDYRQDLGDLHRLLALVETYRAVQAERGRSTATADALLAQLRQEIAWTQQFVRA